MNTEMSYPLTNIDTVPVNDADYESSGHIGKLDRACRFVVGMSVLMALTYGLIAAPASIFAAAVVGFYLILTTIVEQDPFYAIVGNHPLRRFASVSALSSTLSLGAVVSGQFFVPEVISVLSIVGAITGLTAIHHAGAYAMSSDNVQPLSAIDAQGIGPIDVAAPHSEQEAAASRHAA